MLDSVDHDVYPAIDFQRGTDDIVPLSQFPKSLGPLKNKILVTRPIMLKDGLWTRTFIRTSILALRSVTPLSITYCVFRALGWVWTGKRTILRLVDVYAATESVFFLVVYLPRRWLLNSPASPSTLLETPEARERLFLKSWDASPDPREYLTGWFKGVTVEDLRSEDIKDFISWRLWNTLQRSPEHEVELERYVDLVEDILQIKFPPGKSGKTSMAVTFEPLRIVHRPLLWYLVREPPAPLKLTRLPTLTRSSYSLEAPMLNVPCLCGGMALRIIRLRSDILY